MNLLYVAGQFPKTSESFVANEVHAQLEAGHRVRVISLRQPEQGSTLSDLPTDIMITVPRVPFSLSSPTRPEMAVPEERWTRKAYATVAARWVAARLRDFHPDVIHAHFANLPTLVAGHLSALLRVPYTFMPHATDYRQKMSDDLLTRRIRHADGVFVISDAARREIGERTNLSVDEMNALTVVRAAVRPIDLDDPPQPHNHPKPQHEDVTRLVSVARHVPMKGLDLALRAFAQVLPQRPSAHYHLVGDGPETARLEALAADLGIHASVTFHGRLPNEEAQRLVAACDIAVLPCKRDEHGAADGLPVFLMEAGALGIPVVTTAISGIPELVEHERGGIVVPTDDVESLSGALVRLANDRESRQRMGRNLRARVLDEFDRNRQVRRLHDRWSEIRVHTDTDRPDLEAGATREPLSVVVVGRDEAKVIDRCVRHATWADEVLVAVDSRTTDDTGERARSLGARACTVEWRGFSATKNDAVKLASHDWVLSLDADEVVSEQLRKNIERALRSSPDPRDGYALERRSDFLGTLLPNDTRAATRRTNVRLYHREHGSWDEQTQVHEHVVVGGQIHPLPGILVQWRDFTLDELLGRFNRYATLESHELDRRGRRARALDVLWRPIARFGWHYLARGEFRFGSRGLLHSGLKTTAEYMRWAKLWELQHQSVPARDGGLARAVRDH